MSESIARNPAAKRKSELRNSLLAARKTACAAAVNHGALGARVLDVLACRAPKIVGFYWPLPGEFDARESLASWLSLDAHRRATLPVIPVLGAALEFHEWSPGTTMKIGHHRIPEPESARVLIPDLLLIPCVGFDDDGYRLGYGGGYYDRTLAAWPGASRPITVGVAYEACRTRALPREAHDVPLDVIVTDAASYRL